MTVSPFVLFAISFVFSIIIVGVISHYLFRTPGNRPENKRQAGCLLLSIAGLVTIFLFLTVFFASAEVIVVRQNDISFSYERKYALWSYQGHDVEHGKSYIDNQTDKILVLYSVQYSDPSIARLGLKGKSEVIKIESHSFTEAKHAPDYLFYEPYSISVESDKNNETKWILDKYPDVN